jgi:hypothetical protein
LSTSFTAKGIVLLPGKLSYPLFIPAVTNCPRMAHHPIYSYGVVFAFQNRRAYALGFKLMIQIAQRLLAD